MGPERNIGARDAHPAQFKAIYPALSRPQCPIDSLGPRPSDNERSVSILGPGYRPLGPPIPIDQNLQGLPTAVQNLIQLPLPAVMCVDPGTGHIATVSVATGDIVVRGGAPPFPVLSSAPGVAAGLVDPALCAWSPDGRQIAIGTYPQVGQPGPASVALYDVADKTLRFVEPLSGYIAVNCLFFSPDSKILWAGGGGGNGRGGIYRSTHLDQSPESPLRSREPALSPQTPTASALWSPTRPRYASSTRTRSSP